MNKKYLIIFLLFFITLLLTGYIYCDYKEKQITKNNDNKFIKLKNLVGLIEKKKIMSNNS